MQNENEFLLLFLLSLLLIIALNDQWKGNKEDVDDA